MAGRPQARAPQTRLPEEAPPPELLPAPDNGVPYGSETGRSRSRRVRGRQLGHRIPEELYERLIACSDDTGITQQRLLIRGLDEELRKHGH